MSWDVEYTDEFEAWWEGLSEQEQVSLAASVALLEERGPSLGHPPTAVVSMVLATGTCVNCARSTAGGRFARCMPLTPAEWQFY